MMSSSVDFLVRCTVDDWGFMQRVSSSYTLSLLRDEISLRHKFKPGCKFTLSYSTPGCKDCFLKDVDDWEMLIYAVKRYDLDVVDIFVLVDELTVSTGHNLRLSTCVIPQEDYLGAAYKCSSRPKFIYDEWAFYITGVGQKFSGGVVEFREKIKMYAIQIGFLFYYCRNDSRYISLDCQELECEFFIQGCLSASDNSFYIKDCDLDHSCSSLRRSQRHLYLDSDLVSSCMQSDVLYNLAITPNDIIKKFKVYYGFDITYKVALNARYKAVAKLYGNNEESFNKLIWYRETVLESNPGSIFEVEVDPYSNRFERLFVAYRGCIDGFAHCIPVLYLDGCFGKSSYKGQIIAATAKNGNKGIYPVAICVCDSESEDNWIFFLRNLKKITDSCGRHVSFISDRSVGLLMAFDRFLPDSTHLFCYFHLQDNLRKRYKGKGSGVLADKVVKRFLKCAYSSSEIEYRYNLDKLRVKGGPTVIDDFLRDLPLESWCRAFGIGPRYGVMANSLAETFNNWITLERAIPVYSLLEEVRLKEMEMISDRRVQSSKWSSTLTPVMEAKLEEESDKGRKFRVIKSYDGVFEVRDIYSYLVDINKKVCSCKKWQIDAFPCPHALAAISSIRDANVYDYIDSVFTVETFRNCYDCPIIPVSNVDEEYMSFDAPHVEPPVVKSQPGRRRRSRFKSPNEVDKSRKKIRCGRCKSWGNHNRTTCKEALTG